MGVNVSSTVTINVFALEELSEIGKQALIKAADAVMTQVKNTQVMPFDTGTLQNDSTFLDISGADNGRVSVVSSTPYARRLYFHPEYNFQRTYNAFAGGRWFDPWSPSGQRRDFAAQAFQIFYKRLLRNALHG